MIVICEECGKKYNIDPDKIRGERAKFKCKTCNHVITATKPGVDPPDPSAMPEEPPSSAPPSETPVVSMAEQAPVTPMGEKALSTPEPTMQDEKAEAKAKKKSGKKVKGLGLRTKMLILFLFIPIIFIAAAGALYLWQLDDLTSLLTNESSSVVTHMAEDLVANTARAVGIQADLFLQTHPDLKKKDFNYDMDFKKVAVQKVGITGYTCIYAIPDESGVSRLWAHPNAKIIGVDISKVMRKALGKKFNLFWKVYEGAHKGKESKGYYAWKDKDGKIRDKFMVCTPIAGTPYVIAATTYLDEFTKPMKVLRARAEKQAAKTRNITFAILGATIILIGFIVAFYGNRLAARIRNLTDTADRISVGELDAEIEITTKDELGDLAEAIARMQESIRLSIARLRRRR